MPEDPIEKQKWLADRGAYLVLRREDYEDAVLRGYDIPVDTSMHTSFQEAAEECREFNTCQEKDKFAVYWLVPVEA